MCIDSALIVLLSRTDHPYLSSKPWKRETPVLTCGSIVGRLDLRMKEEEGKDNLS